MAETQAGITENSDDDTVSLRDFIRGHCDHLDNGIHELQQTAARLEKMLTEIHAELESARPLLEKWQHSKIRKLATGQMPWGQ